MKAGEFVMRIFHARTAAHVLHLKSKSYAQHMALHEFYDEIVDLIDAYAEAYQGEYGMITDYTGSYRIYDDPVKFMEELCDWIEANRSDFYAKGDTQLQSLVDDINVLTDSTKYKLKVLK
jgi:hypothetical protein